MRRTSTRTRVRIAGRGRGAGLSGFAAASASVLAVVGCSAGARSTGAPSPSATSPAPVLPSPSGSATASRCAAADVDRIAIPTGLQPGSYRFEDVRIVATGPGWAGFRVVPDGDVADPAYAVARCEVSGTWRLVDLGTSEVGCGTVPGDVLAQLGALPCGALSGAGTAPPTPPPGSTASSSLADGRTLIYSQPMPLRSTAEGFLMTLDITVRNNSGRPTTGDTGGLVADFTSDGHTATLVSQNGHHFSAGPSSYSGHQPWQHLYAVTIPDGASATDRLELLWPTVGTRITITSDPYSDGTLQTFGIDVYR